MKRRNDNHSPEPDGKYSKSYKGYRGKNAVYKLIETLLDEQKEI